MEWLIAIPALAAGLITLWNLLTWPRLRSGAPPPTVRVSVLIPARNEERRIEGCVRAAAATSAHEVLVLDDGSTDATRAIVARLSLELPQIKVFDGAPLPPGWIGKPHACQALADAASGDVLMFIDADVLLSPDAVSAVAAAHIFHRADVVTGVPRQRMGSLVESLVLPLLYVTYTSWLPLRLVLDGRDARFLAANGQIFSLSRNAYLRIGGHRAVSDAIVDDMALARAAKRAGLRVAFVDATDVAVCRMYEGARDVIAGFTKNIAPGLGGSALAVALACALYLWAFVAPYIALGIGVVSGDDAVRGAGLLGIGACLLLRTTHVARHRLPVGSALLHPVGVLLLVWIALRSLRATRQGALAWRGRTYPRVREVAQ